MHFTEMGFDFFFSCMHVCGGGMGAHWHQNWMGRSDIGVNGGEF